MGGLDGITEIVNERYQTGAYGNTHFVMSPGTLTALRESAPPPPRSTFGAPLGDLLSIPVRVDEQLPAGAWRLVDNSSDEVICSNDPLPGTSCTTA